MVIKEQLNEAEKRINSDRKSWTDKLEKQLSEIGKITKRLNDKKDHKGNK